MLTYTGILKVKGSEQQVSEKFKKREFVLTDDAASYPQMIIFQLSQSTCGLIEDAKIGDEITAYFTLKGRAWTNPKGEIKYFNTLEVYKIESPSEKASEPTFDNENLVPTPDDDLPF